MASSKQALYFAGYSVDSWDLVGTRFCNYLVHPLPDEQMETMCRLPSAIAVNAEKVVHATNPFKHRKTAEREGGREKRKSGGVGNEKLFLEGGYRPIFRL
jgi:hypothetical protein